MSHYEFKSNMSMDISGENVMWSFGSGIPSELYKFKDLNVSWRVMFYPRFFPKYINYKNDPKYIYEPEEQHTLIKIIIEDQTNELLQYNCRFECEGGIKIDWNFDFSNSEEKVMYDSSMARTMKVFEKTYKIPMKRNQYGCEIFNSFKIKAEIRIRSSNRNLNSSDQFDRSFILPACSPAAVANISKIIAPISARSAAFLACISKIISESKGEDSLPDLIKLATQLLEAAKKFELPDLEKIASGFLDFQISNENFADILEMAVDQKIAALSNLSTDFITKNQKELRQTEQWAKMKACPLMMFSVIEKLFIENDS